jgi:hypothetical protein
MPVCPACGQHEPARPSNQGLPVAVALAALTLAVLLAIVLSGGSNPRAGGSNPRAGGSGSGTSRSRSERLTPGGKIAAATPNGAANFSPRVAIGHREQRPASGTATSAVAPAATARRYNGGAYTLAYPTGWMVATSNRTIANYAETQLETPDAAAKITIDHTPRELTDPAFKAAQVEAATSRTAGYRRLYFRPVMVGDRYAFEWVFTLAGATDPKRADIFVNTGHDGFAFLAHGTDFQRALQAARAVAASVAAKD